MNIKILSYILHARRNKKAKWWKLAACSWLCKVLTYSKLVHGAHSSNTSTSAASQHGPWLLFSEVIEENNEHNLCKGHSQNFRLKVSLTLNVYTDTWKLFFGATWKLFSWVPSCFMLTSSYTLNSHGFPCTQIKIMILIAVECQK